MAQPNIGTKGFGKRNNPSAATFLQRNEANMVSIHFPCQALAGTHFASELRARIYMCFRWYPGESEFVLLKGLPKTPRFETPDVAHLDVTLNGSWPLWTSFNQLPSGPEIQG